MAVLGVMRLFVINSDHEEEDIKSCAITGVYNVMMTSGLHSLLAMVREADEEFELKASGMYLHARNLTWRSSPCVPHTLSPSLCDKVP